MGIEEAVAAASKKNSIKKKQLLEENKPLKIGILGKELKLMGLEQEWQLLEEEKSSHVAVKEEEKY